MLGRLTKYYSKEIRPSHIAKSLAEINSSSINIKNANETTVWQTVEMRIKGLELLRKRLGDNNIDYQELGGYELFGAAQILFTAIIEQVTSIRITSLIIRNARAMRSYNQLIRTIILLFTLALIDYFTLGIETFQIMTYDGISYANIPNDFGNRYQLVFALISIHFSLAVFTFIQYKRLFVEGKSGEAGKSKGSKSSDAPLSLPVVMLLDAVKKGDNRKRDNSSCPTEIVPKTVIIRDE